MATHSSILAWEIPWTEGPCGLQSMGWQSQTQLSNSYPGCLLPLWSLSILTETLVKYFSSFPSFFPNKEHSTVQEGEWLLCWVPPSLTSAPFLRHPLHQMITSFFSTGEKETNRKPITADQEEMILNGYRVGCTHMTGFLWAILLSSLAETSFFLCKTLLGGSSAVPECLLMNARACLAVAPPVPLAGFACLHTCKGSL